MPDARTQSTPPAPLPEEHARTLAALRERIKELDCLYEITRLSQRHDLALDDILNGTSSIVARAWQYPDIACVRVHLGDHVHTVQPMRRVLAKQHSPIAVHGETVGRIEVGYTEKCPPADEGPFLKEERHLLDAVADHVGRIIEARNTSEQLRRLSRELIKAQENERSRIARELHDDVAQRLSMIRMRLDGLSNQPTQAPSGTTSPEHSLARECSTQLGMAIATLRDLSYDLLPPVLGQLGFVQTAHRLCQERAIRFGLPITFHADGMETVHLPFETSINLYRVLQEALSNACRHGCCSHIKVRIIASYPHCLLHVVDDGQGFDPDTRLAQALAEKHMGLWSMHERIRLLGGRLSISSKPGNGVRIRAEVPLGEQTT